MATLGVMKARIADEIARSDLTSQIALAIQTAIEFHDGKRFSFNEAQDTFSTVAAQEWYTETDATWIIDVRRFDSVRITVSGRPYPLTKRTFAWMERFSAGTPTSGDPTDYCYYKRNIRLYPVPNAVRTISVSYVQKLEDLATDADENAWTDEAEELTRLRAKIILFEDVIRDDAAFKEADRIRLKEGEVLSKMITQYNASGGAGFLVAETL